MSLFADRRLKRPIGLLLLVCMVVLIAGVPLPVLRQKSITSPFPCQDSPCGCENAAQCWDKCCCNSDSEKLAWAANNHVVPPTFLVERVARHQVNLVGIAAKHPACCSLAKPEAASCCETASKGKAAEKPMLKKPTAKDANVRIVLLEAINKCKGIELAIRLFSSALVGARHTAIELPVPFILYLMVVGNDAADSLSASIDPPIP